MCRKASRWAFRADSAARAPPLSSSPPTNQQEIARRASFNCLGYGGGATLDPLHIALPTNPYPTYHGDRVRGAELGGPRAVLHSEEDALLTGQHGGPAELVVKRASDAHRAQGQRKRSYRVRGSKTSDIRRCHHNNNNTDITSFDVLVLEQVVQGVDRRLTREEHLEEDEVCRAPIDGDERSRRVRRLDGQQQQVQARVDYVQRRPGIQHR